AGEGHIEGHPVVVGVDRHRVGADLVGEVAVGGHAVAPHHHQVDLPLGHQAGSHVVGDQGGGDVVVNQLVGGEAGALEQGAGLVGVNHLHFPRLVSRPDHPQGGTVAAGGQG